MEKKISMSEDLICAINQFLVPSKDKVEKMLSMLQKIENSLDAYLDKPLDDDNVHLACGDALEGIIRGLRALTDSMDYYSIEYEAKAKAWEKYPFNFWDGEDMNESARTAYVKGYMDAKIDKK